MTRSGLFPGPAEPRLPVTTMDLLNMALQKQHLGAWARRLGLSEEALRTARSRGRLSPMIAGALAEDLEQDPAKWIVIAALETERESACRTRMIQRFANAKHWPCPHRPPEP
jgi:hypothetical protein